MGEMAKLKAILKPKIAILTNIGSAHDENFTGREQKTNEKLNLLRDAETVIVCKDNPALFSKMQVELTGSKIISWSRKTKADLQISRVTKEKSTKSDSPGETLIKG